MEVYKGKRERKRSLVSAEEQKKGVREEDLSSEIIQRVDKRLCNLMKQTLLSI